MHLCWSGSVMQLHATLNGTYTANRYEAYTQHNWRNYYGFFSGIIWFRKTICYTYIRLYHWRFEKKNEQWQLHFTFSDSVQKSDRCIFNMSETTIFLSHSTSLDMLPDWYVVFPILHIRLNMAKTVDMWTFIIDDMIQHVHINVICEGNLMCNETSGWDGWPRTGQSWSWPQDIHMLDENFFFIWKRCTIHGQLLLSS